MKIDGLIITATPAMAAVEPRHRDNIRTALINHLATHTAPNRNGPDLTHLADLTRRPRLDGWAISISHCPLIGGFALAPGSFGLGIDFEITNRVSAKAAMRIATTEAERKIAAASNATAFWAAKESAIKAFGNLGHVDLQFESVEVTALSEAGSFTARWMSHEARGDVLSQKMWTVALARSRSSVSD